MRLTLEGQTPEAEMDPPLALLWSNSGSSSVTRLAHLVKVREGAMQRESVREREEAGLFAIKGGRSQDLAQ